VLPVSLYIFALMFLGHVFGDFLLQTEAIARGKQTRTRILIWHVTQHVLATVVLLALGWSRLRVSDPELSPALAELGFAVGVVAVTHLGIDKLKILADQRWGGRPSFFVLDQLAHVAVLTLVVAWLTQRHADWSIGDHRPIFVMGEALGIATVAGAILVLAALLYALRGGAILAWLVTDSMLRDRSPEEMEDAGVSANPLRDGRRLYLGYAERLVAMGLLVAGALWHVGFWVVVLLLYLGRVLWMAKNSRQKGWSSLWARYRLRELAASAATVLAVGTWILWLIP
jgi:hypothetical protein